MSDIYCCIRVEDARELQKAFGPSDDWVNQWHGRRYAYVEDTCSVCAEPIWHNPDYSEGHVLVCWQCVETYVEKLRTAGGDNHVR